MMIDTKKFEEYVSKRTELVAETVVLEKLNTFMFENTIKSRNERNLCELQAWMDISKDVQEIIQKRLDDITVEIQKLREQLDKEEA